MKIVHVSISSSWGEIYAYQENLLPHYHRIMGHEVTIIAPIYSRVEDDTVEPIGESLLKDGSKLIRLAPIINSMSFFIHMHLVKGLKKAILAESPDLLFIHDVGSFNFLCLRDIKRKSPKVKIVFDNHVDLVNSLHSPFTLFLHKVIYKHFLVPSLAKVSDIFYGVTPTRCDFLHTIYGIPNNKIKLLVMGADDEIMMFDKRDKLRYEIRNEYGVKNDDFLLVTGGKIDPLKNIHTLAHAVNKYRNPKVKLLVFGKIREDMKNIFDAEVSQNVLTIGWVNSEQVYKYFYAADLIVFPGLHSVLWEQAVASGTPCAFSKIDGFEHLLVNDNCILMEGKNVDYYESMIKELVERPYVYEKLKHGANSPAIKRFYYSKIAQQVIDDVGLN